MTFTFTRKRLLFGVLLILWLGIPYVGLQYIAIREIYIVPPMAADRWISLQPLAIYPYLSWYGLMLLTHFTCCEDPCFKRWWFGAGLIGILSSLVFLLWPTGIERSIAPSSALHAWLISIDQPRNALPSLHASLAVYAGLIFSSSLPNNKRAVASRATLWLWILLILWSTIAIRQHVFADILCGALLGLGIYQILYWKSR